MGSQNNGINQDKTLLSFEEKGKKMGIIFFFLSLLMHGFFFGGLIFFNQFRPPKPMPEVIQIDLVSFSPETLLNEEPDVEETSESVENEETPEEKSVPVTPPPVTPPPQKADRKIPVLKPDISLKTKPKNLKDLIALQEKKKEKPKELKKKPVDKKPRKDLDKEEAASKKIPEKAKNKPKEKPKDEYAGQIAKALSRLQKKVAGQDKKKAGDQTNGYAGQGKKGYKPIEMYKMVLRPAIEQNWVFNETLAKMDKRLEVRILIKILKSGEIRDIIFETRSGNRHLDESAKKAIKKSNPLPQLPPGMSSWDVVVIFTPKGLK